MKEIQGGVDGDALPTWEDARARQRLLEERRGAMRRAFLEQDDRQVEVANAVALVVEEGEHGLFAGHASSEIEQVEEVEARVVVVGQRERAVEIAVEDEVEREIDLGPAREE